MRAMYETSTDLQNEASTCDVLSGKWNCTFSKLPISYRLDYGAFRLGRLVSFLELKRRRVDRFSYASVLISLSKLVAARQFLEVTGKKSFFVVSYDDCIAYVSLNEAPDYVAMGGRTDRGDSADIEPVAHFNTKRLVVV